MTGRHLLGVDGGNTKTVALLAMPSGELIAADRELGCADLHSVGPQRALEVINGAIDKTLTMAAVEPSSIRVSSFSLAGADWPENLQLLRRSLQRRWPRPLIVNDALGALRSAVPSGLAVVVAAGTGATTAARAADGSTWHAGFWQQTQGSAELAEQALRAIYRADLGIDPPTELTSRLLSELGVRDVEAILHDLSRRTSAVSPEIGSLAPTILDVAEEGDATARQIVVDHGTGLGHMAVAAARRVGIEDRPFSIVLVGGLFRHPGALMREALLSALRSSAPLAIESPPAYSPSAGGLLLAFDAAGIRIAGDVERRLLRTMPSDELFDTHPRALVGTRAASVIDESVKF